MPVGMECSKTKTTGSKLVSNGDNSSDPLPADGNNDSTVNPFTQTLQQAIQKAPNTELNGPQLPAQIVEQAAGKISKVETNNNLVGSQPGKQELPSSRTPATSNLSLLITGISYASAKQTADTTKINLQDVLNGKPKASGTTTSESKQSAPNETSGLLTGIQAVLCPALLTAITGTTTVSAAPVSSGNQNANSVSSTSAKDASVALNQTDGAVLAPNLGNPNVKSDSDTLVFEGKFQVIAGSAPAQTSSPLLNSQTIEPTSIQSQTINSVNPATAITKPQAVPQNPTLPAENQFSEAIQSTLSTTLKQNLSGNDSRNQNNNSNQNILTPIHVSDSVAATEKNPTDNTTAATTNTLSKSSILPIDQQANGTTPSMKNDLTVRLQGQSGETINVRMTERGGEVQIAIRSTDPATAAALRHEMPSIQAGLERAGLHLDSGSGLQPGGSKDSSAEEHTPDQQKRGETPTGQGRRQQQQKNSADEQWFNLTQN